LTGTEVEEHLGAFPKLLSASNQSYIEAENILGPLYFISITITDSNILKDLDFLSQLGDLTRGFLANTGVDEASIPENSLELIFASDECIPDGHWQNVTVSEVVTCMGMDEFNAVRAKKEP
jgi:hypothetical protein